MISARVMYFRPGNLFKRFLIESNDHSVSSTGRVVNKYNTDSPRFLTGCITSSTDEDRKNHNVGEHVVSHTIVQKGGSIAKKGDRLVLNDKSFYVVDVEDIGMVGVSSVYYVEERNGVQ